MGAGNPGPGAGIGQPGVEQAQPANLNPGVHPAPPEFPIYVKEEVRYLQLKTELGESLRDVRGLFNWHQLDPGSFSTKEIEFAIFGFAGQLNLRLVHRSRKVNVVTLSSVISRNQSTRFLLSPLDTGNPGEPAAILRFESVERMPPDVLQDVGRPKLVWEVAVWIEPVRGKWIDGRGDPILELGTVPAHAVMFPGKDGSTVLFWGPARVRDTIQPDLFVADATRRNGGWKWNLGDTKDMETLYWSRTRGNLGPRPVPNPRPGELHFGGFSRQLNLFCAGQVLLADGRAFLAGGHIGGPGTSPAASHIVTFDPDPRDRMNRPLNPLTFSWTLHHGELAGQRWYPTLTTLPDGSVIIQSGIRASFGYLPSEFLNPATGVLIATELGSWPEAPVRLPQDYTTVDPYDLYHPDSNSLDPAPRPSLIRDNLQACYPNAYVMPRGSRRGMTMRNQGGVLFVQERRWAYLFTLPTLGPMGRGILPQMLRPNLDPPADMPNAPPIFEMKNRGSRNWPWYGVSALLPLDVKTPTKARVLTAGGTLTQHAHAEASILDVATNTAEIFEYDGNNSIFASRDPLNPISFNSWTPAPSMRFARILTDTIILADGNVMVTGGAQLGMTDESYLPVLYPELFDPVRNEWHIMAKSPTERRYHSVALLLEDGTLLNAGSHGGLIPERNNIVPQFHADVFLPPYLFRAPRPKVLRLNLPFSRAVPAAQQIFFPPFRPEELPPRPEPRPEMHIWVESDEADDEFRMCLVRFGGTTHGNYMDQRFIWLEIVQQEPFEAGPIGVNVGGTTIFPDIVSPLEPLEPGHQRWKLHFVVPANSTLFPPGHYMLFVLNKYNVPSIGKFVVIDPSNNLGEADH